MITLPTLLGAAAFGFAVVTGIVLMLMAVMGLLVALYVAVPHARELLYRHTVSAEKQMRDQALAELDRSMMRYLADINQRRSVVIDLLR